MAYLNTGLVTIISLVLQYLTWKFTLYQYNRSLSISRICKYQCFNISFCLQLTVDIHTKQCNIKCKQHNFSVTIPIAQQPRLLSLLTGLQQNHFQAWKYRFFPQENVSATKSYSIRNTGMSSLINQVASSYAVGI